MNATRIVEWSRRGGVRRRKLAQVILVLLFSFDLPPDVKVGEGVTFLHNCLGTVISPVVELGDGCMVYQNVTIGDAEMYRGGVLPERPRRSSSAKAPPSAAAQRFSAAMGNSLSARELSWVPMRCCWSLPVITRFGLALPHVVCAGSHNDEMAG